ncbi:MAG: DUF3866 family protein, partial [Coriobacteriales bacterium]|nr:DUF3866 family protein [Coriobacteriales bacterium]
MRLVPGIVKEILFASNDLQVVNVSCEGSERQACNYLALGAAVAVDDTVLLNTTAVDLQLGTGGVHFVVPNKAVETDTGYGHGHGDGSSGNGHGDGSSVLFSS